MILRQNADRLIRKLENSSVWPWKYEKNTLENIYKWQWFREADATRLKNAHPGGWDDDKTYLVDPLASRISEAFADLQFGEEPDFMAGDKADQARLEDLVFENGLPGELQVAAEMQVAEGETWWRARVEKDALDWPIIEFHSRTHVVPLYRGIYPIAVAFISVIEDDENAWRYVECHAEGIVLNRLYKVPLMPGSYDNPYGGSLIPHIMHAGKPFGTPVPLTDRPETEDLDAEWEHDLPMLAGRVINKRGRNPRLGLSQFARVEGLLFSLNEAATIGQDNMRLTARKRVTVTEGALEPPINPETGEPIAPRPVFNTQESVLVDASMDENLDSNKQGQFKILEYSFDAQAMIAWTEHLVDTVLIRTRTAPALVGRGVQNAQTAPALRARLLDSTLAANGKARYWDDQVPVMLRALQQLDALSIEQGGFGRGYSDANEKPKMKRKSVIPEDPKDVVDRHAVAMGSELESRYTAIAEYRPDWSDTQIKEEIARIDEDQAKALEMGLGKSNGPGIPNGSRNNPARGGVPETASGDSKIPGIADR